MIKKRRIVVEVDDNLHRQVKMDVARNNSSITALVIRLLTRHIREPKRAS